MSNINQNRPPLRAVRQGLFPTMNNLDEVVALGNSKLPITCPNELQSLLFTYHNTLLKEIQDGSNTSGGVPNLR